MKFLIYCDFATLTCDEAQFAKALSLIDPQPQNLHHGNLWLVETPGPESFEIPFANSCQEIYQLLQNFTTKNSTLIVSQIADIHGTLLGDNSDPLFEK